MIEFFEYGAQLIQGIQNIGESLTSTFNVPFLGDVSVLGLILGSAGGGLFSLLTYRVIKWFTDLIL